MGGVFQFCEGVIVATHGHQASRQRVVILRRGFESDRLAELLLGFVERLRLEQRSSQVVVGKGGIGA